jgi:transposase
MSESKTKYKDQDWLYHQYVDLGKNSFEIAELVDVTPGYIRELIRDNNIGRKYEDEEWLQHQYVESRNEVGKIAEKCNCSTDTIRDRLNKFDIERDRRYREEDWLREKYDKEQLSCGEIAEICNVHRDTIGKWLDKNDIEARSFSEQRDVYYERYIDTKLADEDWLREMFTEKEYSTFEIADMLDETRPRVEYYVEKFDLECNHGPEKYSEHDRLNDEEYLYKKYHGENKTLEDISELLGVSIDAVRNRMIKFGIDRRDIEGENHPYWKGGVDLDYKQGWRVIRKQALHRDQHRCQRCGMTEPENRAEFSKGLHVHHITPYREFEDDEKAHSLDNLITLCVDCHFNVEYNGEVTV